MSKGGELFVDTSAWYPLADRRHPDHADFAGLLRDRLRTGVRLVTTNLVVAETHALLLRRGGRGPAHAFLAEVRQDPIAVVSSTPKIVEAAITDWLHRFDDQPFTLTDAVSFAVMTLRGIREALALDRHFQTAGFVVLPPAAR
ncbi:MAG: PIN domain-containing protein [Gemmatimonadota bacterium]